MRLFNINELSRYSNATLRTLAVRMELILGAAPAFSAERYTARANLRTIREALALRAPSAG